MHHGSALLGKQFIRQLIWETFNRHRPSGKPDIALIGSRRSGSTLLMEMIARNPGVKSINQPCTVFGATTYQMMFLPWPAGGLFLDPDDDERKLLSRYINRIRSGELHIQEPWRIWQRDFHFRSDRCVFKTTDEQYIESLYNQLNFQIIRFFRHPIPQAISCRRNRWGDKLSYFGKAEGFLDGYLNPEISTEFRQIRKEGSELQKYVLGWCCENLPLFNFPSYPTLTVYYEELIVDPAPVIEDVSLFCELKSKSQMKAMLRKASISVKNLSESKTAKAIQAGDRHSLVGSWLDLMQRNELESVQSVLDLFRHCNYRADDPFPIDRS